ncbi:flagellar motor switch protein FliG [Salinarimonas sp. NSM]|uniref:flagellar motor switch protein FliG n=1 Tax=Salinarimonas sp. NSM TaxID=3458003 RepID=UPI004035678A
MAASAITAAATAALAANDEFDGLPGPQRAALFLLLLGEQHGKAIWAMLDEEEVRTVSHAMVQLGTVDASTVERLIVDFIQRLSNSGVSGSVERTEQLLMKVFPPDQVAIIMAEIYNTSGKRIWTRLSQIDAEILANYLRSEYPQTVAVILSRVRPDHAARVLTMLPDDFALDVVNRMLKLETVQKEALHHIEETLRLEFVGAVAQTAKRDAHEAMAEVFNAFDRQTETRFLSALDDLNREAAKRIRQLMFTFEDLTKLDPASAQTLIRQVDKQVLCKALKGSPEPVRAFFLGNMSSRAAKNLNEEMESLGPIRIKDVDEAQLAMVNLAKELADKGDIMISKNRAEEELIY